MSKEAILSKVRDSISNNNISSYKVEYSNPMVKVLDTLEEYKLNQTNNKAIVIESKEDTLLKSIEDILIDIKAKRVLYNTNIDINFKSLSYKCEIIPYVNNIDIMRNELFNIDVSIVKACCGVSNLGLIGICSQPNAPRLSSLITNTCIYLLNKENIVENLYDGVFFIKNYEKIRTNTDILPSNIVFVAGPSRTADIELKTVFGVHGSRVTYVILY